MAEKCVVSFSGGQDSTTVAAWAKKNFDAVSLIGFDYNQKHKIELTQAKTIAQKLGLDLHIIPIEFFSQIVESALLQNSQKDINAPHCANPDLPASFVPNRNALFITIAHSFAQKIGARHLALGVSEQDYSGYPDCRAGFIASIEASLNLGSSANIKIHTPLMRTNKAQEFALARDLGVLEIVLEDTHTCYEGVREIRHPWGYGCGECNACVLRKKGYEKYIDSLG
ncbi:7-cyano-7-deazaguanine synthase QueC [Helicobacter sp. 11S02596-1]|uniref:7-cyano-7-deazaguanine synthase QueC n=1 Tax=Helicobacter sp. 11S02596-1 TaxID=1476194 RepID=UPI000BA57940|nr:7-cyano-7-deazaguanine synthase QueC [Helicobacter sp. 11S02596-1]PAF43206.1 7-cyano-7-deazaguanine synthase QueC [Helicobacter sp. 11S02596-1]